MIFQLFCVNCIFWITKTPHIGPQNFLLVLFGTPVLALLGHFWVKIRAPVRPNRQRWTGFDWLILLGVNSEDFPFFKTSLALLEAELAPFKDWEEIEFLKCRQFLINL